MSSESNKLWMLLRNNKRNEVAIMKCLDEHPEFCTETMGLSGSDLPIFHAIDIYLSEVIIQKMLTCYPECCGIEDQNGLYLLHKVVMNDSPISEDIISSIIDVNPDITRISVNGDYPLHMECNNQCRHDIITKLYSLYPEANRMSSRGGSLPLHSALNSSTCSSTTIFFLINEYPEAVQVLRNDDDLPIHIECVKQCRYDVIMKLLELFPESVKESDQSMFLPLHCAMDNLDSKVDVVVYLIDLYPIAVHMKSELGNLPLHLECSNLCRYDVVVKLLEICPEAINMPSSSFINLPLHLALINFHSQADVVMYLIDRYPKAASIKKLSYPANFPLHLECGHHCRFEVIIRLLDIYPEAISLPGHANNLPLHYAICSKKSQHDSVMHLIEYYPDAVSMKRGRKLPLHLECEHHCRYDIIKKLLDIYSEGSDIRNADGSLPLHVSLLREYESPTPSESIIYLILQNPTSARMEDSFGGLPLHIECEGRCRYDVIVKLLEAYPDAISIVDRVGYLPIHHALNECKYGLSCIYDAIQFLFMKYPAAVRSYYHNNLFPFRVISSLYTCSFCSFPLMASKLTSSDRLQWKAMAVDVLNVYPPSLYLPDDDPLIDSSDIRADPMEYRLLLNLAAHHLLPSSEHMHDYHSINYQSRSPLLYVIHQASSSDHHTTTTNLSLSSNAADPMPSEQRQELVTSSSAIKDSLNNMIYAVLASMISAAGRIEVGEGDYVVSYAWIKGDDLGSVLLRRVVYYL